MAETLDVSLLPDVEQPASQGGVSTCTRGETAFESSRVLTGAESGSVLPAALSL